jgi:hypothetical protein
MEFAAVAYRSTAVSGLGSDELDHLLVGARAHNRMEGVTGVLLYDGRHFFQYFEGEAAGVARIYARIRASRLHVDLQELQHGPVSQLYFRHWYMGCRQTGNSVLQQLSSQQWRREATALDGGGADDPPGLQQLRDFWARQEGVAR